MNKGDFKRKESGYALKYLKAESFFKNSMLLECIQHHKERMKGKLLDLGCGNKPYSVIYDEVCDSSTGCDVPFSLHKDTNVEVLCYAEDIDKHFGRNEFDCVLCTEVIEHTIDDRKVMGNINKVLKLNGILLLSAPFTYVLHEAPHDYRRYTIFGLTNLLESNGFEIVSVYSMGGSFSSGFFVFYYTFTKIFHYIFKKAGLEKLSRNAFVHSILSIPESIFCFFNLPILKKKLSGNIYPTVNEQFSSLGYFFVAEKTGEL